MRKLFLMRHGQTLFNQMGKRQGWCDSPLTEHGIEQAKQAKKYFDKNNINFDKAYCSTLERASDTLEIITSIKYERLKELKEWNFGIFEGQDEELQGPIRKGAVSYEDYWVKFGGEDEVDLAERMNNAVEYMISNGGDNILAVSHAGALRTFIISRLEKREDIKSMNLKFRNCSIFVFEISEEGNLNLIDNIDPTEAEVEKI